VQLSSDGTGENDEESIPLHGSEMNGYGRRSDEEENGDVIKIRKGKEKAVVFDVGSDDEDGEEDRHRT